MTGSLRPLRPHQRAALDQLDQSFLAGHRRTIVQAPTGAGKTVIAAHLVDRARQRNQRVAFCVPSIGLIGQTAERFSENGLDMADMGVIQADHPWRRPHAPIQICSAQTLARRELPEADVVIIDEAHIQHRVYHRWLTDPDSGVRQFIGLTATPWAKGMGKLWDDLVKPTSTRELIDLGHLAPFRVFAPSHPDLKGVKTVAGDYHEGQLADRMCQGTLVADIVAQWLRRGKGLPTICFCVNRAHAQLVAGQFREADIRVAYVDANTPREERDEIGQALAQGDVEVVVNIGCLTTGIDWDVRCLILARPTKSEMLFVQIIGRALRTADGKDTALILDHSDTHLRLGMVTDIDHDHLDDGSSNEAGKRQREERDIPLPKECQRCAALVPAGISECPECGHHMRPPVRVEVLDGDLVEMGSGPAGQRTVRDEVRDMGKQAVWMQLLGFADERGRKRGWAAYTYKDLFGVWPRGLQDFPGVPSPLMRSWLRSRDIAFAKSQQGRRAA